MGYTKTNIIKAHKNYHSKYHNKLRKRNNKRQFLKEVNNTI